MNRLLLISWLYQSFGAGLRAIPGVVWGRQLVLLFISIFIGVAYQVLLIGAYGATLGPCFLWVN